MRDKGIEIDPGFEPIFMVNSCFYIDLSGVPDLFYRNIEVDSSPRELSLFIIHVLSFSSLLSFPIAQTFEDTLCRLNLWQSLF